MNLTHIGPTDHVDGGEMHGHECRVLDNLIGQVDAESVAREPAAESHRAVLAAKGNVRVEVKDSAVLPKVGLMGDCFDVILAVLDEAAVRERSAVLEEAAGEPATGTEHKIEGGISGWA